MTVNRRLSMATSAAPTAFGPMLFAGRVLEGVGVAAELGYDGIEISLRDVGELDERALRAALERHGMVVSALGSGRVFLEDGLCFSHADPSVRRAAVLRLQTFVDLAARVNALVIVGLVRGARPCDEGGGREAVWIAECLSRLADHAAGRGVGLVVEAINRYETAFINTAAELVELLETVGSPDVRGLLDVFHMNIEEASLPEAIRTAGSRLGYVHVVDSNRWAPGFGHVPFEPIVQALEQIGYEGWLSAEILPRPDDRRAAEQARRFVSGWTGSGPAAG